MAFFYHRINWTPLHLTAKWDHFEAAEILLAAGADVNATNITTFFLNFDIFILYFLWYFSFYITYKTPFELAFMFGRNKVGRVLRKAGGEVSNDYFKQLTSDEKQALSKFGL